MNQTGTPSGSNGQRPGLLHGSPIRRHFFLIVLYYIAVCLLAFAVYLIVPKYYRATATILQPPETEASTAKGSRLSEELVANIRTNTELFLSLLGSRRMKDDLITRYNLVQIYSARNMDEAREILSRRLKIVFTREKVIQLELLDTGRERVAEMVNFYLDNLDRLIKELTITTAKQNRIFIEERLRETSEQIAALEAQLQRLQETNRFVADPELAQITQAGGAIMQKLVDKQLELERKRLVLNDTDEQIILLKREIADLKQALSHLLDSRDELLRVLRELKIQKSVYSLLTSKLEEAKINEARDTPIVQVLDRAAVPDKVYRPDLKMIMMLVSAVVGGVGFLVIFVDILKYLGSI
ncbi:MAG TPA: GNVR domain-containing protein [bacterium]|nr:GNVR domain-containing protein [bacterium]